MWRPFVRQVIAEATILQALQRLVQRLDLTTQSLQLELLRKNNGVQLFERSLLEGEFLLQLDHLGRQIVRCGG